MLTRTPVVKGDDNSIAKIRFSVNQDVDVENFVHFDTQQTLSRRNIMS
jgi:hypothetical protein